MTAAVPVEFNGHVAHGPWPSFVDAAARTPASYWNLSSPVYLFFSGSSNWVDSTRRAGVFLPMAVCMAAGLVDFIVGPRSRIAWIVIAGFATAPLGAVFVGEPWAVQRELELLPFAALLGTYGIRRLWLSGNQRGQWVTVILLVLMPLQFADFSRDYFTDYRLNSLGWFGPPLDGVVSRVLLDERDRGAVPVLLSRAIPYGRDHWLFQLAKVHREDILDRTSSFDERAPFSQVAPGTIVVEPLIDGQPLDPILRSLNLTPFAVLPKADGGLAVWMLRR